MGAWIETFWLQHILYHCVSHPTWVRGLKLNINVQIIKDGLVAPYVGAWIETWCYLVLHSFVLSHPTWVRGLKRQSWCYSSNLKLSHPTWVRGLKPFSERSNYSPLVAPYVGAWIETTIIRRKNLSHGSHPTWVRGLKPKISLGSAARKRVAPYVGAWIETNLIFHNYGR